MTTLLGALSVFSLCASALALSGCEVSDCTTEDGKDAKCAESLKQFTAAEQTRELDYVEGASLTIQGNYGDIAVLPGTPGVVRVTFKPFNWRGHGQEAEAELELEENLDLTASLDAGGNVLVATDRHDATNGLGSHVTVRLPPEFSGTLIAENAGDGAINPGYIDVQFVGEATTLNVANRGLGLCSVLRGDDDEPSVTSKLTEVDVRCEDDIIVRGVNDNVFVKNTSPSFHSDVVVEIVSISADAKGGSVLGENSNVQVTLPRDADFDVLGSTRGAGSRIARLESADCEVLVDEAAEVELSCGAGGPVYEVRAVDTDDDGESTRLNLYVR
jgi:hypothetical protein